ncbi:YqfO family protein [Litoribacillus peritrichatus]|uniref:YqfO family protein n=1 Tax=Litoribacillus peritrichatus TaxID=718191 RepID=A0ABP7M476_9GAMM
MYKIAVFIPESHLDEVKQALFDAGAGRIGNYDQCCWQVKGQGQFRALEGSDPFLGQCGELEQVEEYKVELVCEDALLIAALTAMKEAHPYEEPAYDVYLLEDL